MPNELDHPDRPLEDAAPRPVLPAAIPYADPITQYGLTYEEDPKTDTVIITVPAPVKATFRIAEAVVPFAMLLYVIGTLVAIVMLYRLWKQTGDPPIVAQLSNFACLAFFGAGAYTGVRAWIRKGMQRSRIELSAEALRIQALDLEGSPRRWRIDRNRVLEVKAGPVPWNAAESISMGLHIRIANSETMEVLPGHDRAVAEWVAAMLSRALKELKPKPD